MSKGMDKKKETKKEPKRTQGAAGAESSGRGAGGRHVPWTGAREQRAPEAR